MALLEPGLPYRRRAIGRRSVGFSSLIVSQPGLRDELARSYFFTLTPITATLSVTLGAFALSATGSLPIVGQSNITLESVSLSSTGSLQIRGSLSQTLDSFTLNATGELAQLNTGSLTVTLGGFVLTATAKHVWPAMARSTVTRTRNDPQRSSRTGSTHSRPKYRGGDYAT